MIVKNLIILKSKYSFLYEIFLNDLNRLSRIKIIKEITKKKKTNVYDATSELYNVFLRAYFDEE